MPYRVTIDKRPQIVNKNTFWWLGSQYKGAIVILLIELLAYLKWS